MNDSHIDSKISEEIWLLAFIALVTVFGVFVVDGVSIEVYEYTDDPQIPWFEFDVVKDSDDLKGASGTVNLSRNWTERLQDCRQNPKCTVVD